MFRQFFKSATPYLLTKKSAVVATTTTTTSALLLFWYAQQQQHFVVEKEKQAFFFSRLYADEAATTSTIATLYNPTENPLMHVLANKQVKDYQVTLYQYQVCPFCCKVRAFLDYHKIPYKIVEVNPVFKGEINFSTKYKKVPIIIVEGQQINDSSLIISSFSQVLGRKQTDDEMKWREWVDKKFVHVLAPNIYRSPTEAAEAFDYISEQNQFGALQKYTAKYAGSTVMYMVSKNLKKRHNITDERQAIYDCANTWVNEGLKGNPRSLHGGNSPDLADLAVYGILTSIEGLHAFNDMMQHSKIGPWFEMMKQTVGKSSGVRQV